MNNYLLDWNKYTNTAIEVAEEGAVLLCNKSNTLPLKKDEKIAVFGRIQFNYYKSGTGSGGMVNISECTSIIDALKTENTLNINEKLYNAYKNWVDENPFELGNGWGMEPWSQIEMPLENDFVKEISAESDTAIVVIGRTAGEEQDNKAEKGSYFLSDGEEKMLELVTTHFEKVVVLLNVGGIIDMNFIEKYKPSSVLYLWQAGMIGGIAAANLLVGKSSPSGKLPDTIAYKIEDYPSDKNFGDLTRNFYAEDIFVGYRYFETFAKDKVLFPFGFGLSYTTFEKCLEKFSVNSAEKYVEFEISIKNTGDFSAKEVVSLYAKAPQGELGKAERVLCGFEKTEKIAPSEKVKITLKIPFSDFASFDDLGVTGKLSSFILEAGLYEFFLGGDVRNAVKIADFEIAETILIEKLSKALAPVLPFKRMKAVEDADGKIDLTYENVNPAEFLETKHRKDDMPAEIAVTSDRGIKLSDVKSGKSSLNDFIAQLTDHELACLARSEGMCSPKVTAGTASAFGGMTEKLKYFGIPAVCCADGPSGIRMDSGTKAFSIPNGTLIASTFNKNLAHTLFEFVALELRANKVDILLAPGMNIHRHPLNGRNFEYYSEDPLLTGRMAAAEISAFNSLGVAGAIKHFCGNNQETGRHVIDSVISERALREIYLKGFEIAVKEGKANTIMTSYGSVNGLWTAGSYDLVTRILRKEWGFKGFVMTDWWANINSRGEEPDKTNFAQMCSAGNDVYMCCPDSENNDDNIMDSLKTDKLNRSELQRNAKNICEFIANTPAMERFIGEEISVDIINRPVDEDEVNPDDAERFIIDGDTEIDLSYIDAKKGSSYYFFPETYECGNYKLTISGSTKSGELCQIPVTFYSNSTAMGTAVWSGGNNEEVISHEFDCYIFSRFCTLKLYFAEGGLSLKTAKFHKVD